MNEWTKPTLANLARRVARRGRNLYGSPRNSNQGTAMADPDGSARIRSRADSHSLNRGSLVWQAMKLLRRVLDSNKFWRGLAIATAAFVVLYLIIDARNEADANTRTIAAQRQAIQAQEQVLIYLCDTVHVLDIVYVQSAKLDTLALKDESIPPSVRELIRHRRDSFLKVHQDLSETGPCRQVE